MALSPLETAVFGAPPEMLAIPILRWMGIAVLLGVIALIGQTLYLLRKLALRPHPFVDISS